MFVTADEEPQNVFDINYTEVSESEIASTLRELGVKRPLGMDSTQDFRLSIAGAQEKTAFLKMKKKWCKPFGSTPTTHIFKTPIGAMGSDFRFDDSIDNEWSCLKILLKFGIEVCHAHIESFEDQRALVIERFDRKWEQINGKEFIYRIPQEDMCQAMGLSPFQKYQSEGGVGIKEIAQYFRTSVDYQDLETFFKTIMLFDLLYATDGHAKNFSVFLKRAGVKLTPIYDVTSVYSLIQRKQLVEQKVSMAMKVGNSGDYKLKRIQLRHYQETAKLCGLSDDVFDKIYEDIKYGYRKLVFDDNEIPSEINQESLSSILEGMEKRAKVIFS